MMYWFTSDEHLNHENIITKFVFRPFKSVEEMNDAIVSRHNERVKEDDVVFHLGDFKLSAQGQNTHDLRKRLNGNHVFLRGNHDKNNGMNTPIRHIVIETFGKKVLLVHRPEDAIDIMNVDKSIDLAFVGHVHEKWKVRDKMINVGVDQWNFYPVHAKQILKAYSQITKGRDYDNIQNP